MFGGTSAGTLAPCSTGQRIQFVLLGTPQNRGESNLWMMVVVYLRTTTKRDQCAHRSYEVLFSSGERRVFRGQHSQYVFAGGCLA